MKKTPARILVVDDERSSRINIRDFLSMEDIEVKEAEDGLMALDLVKTYSFDCVLLDIRMPKLNGMQVLSRIREFDQSLPVVMFTAFGTSERAIQAMKDGAFDYLVKPFDLDELHAVVHRAIEYRRMSKEVEQLRQRLAEVEAAEFRPDQFVSDSPVMQKVFKLIGKVAATNATVLIEGETGTGKELAANAIWYHSNRRQHPFIKVNCAAIPEGLLESELFGHEKGAFTGASTQRKGHFEIADGGTLFLDEIGDMSPKLQSKLLRVLEQSEFQRVGGKTTVRVDVRILAATNKNLLEETKAGNFREDLYYRLQVMHITLPPLRRRKEDIRPLVSHFLKKYGHLRDLLVTKEAMTSLAEYPWPGNVRELENVIERATVLAQGKIIALEHLSLSHAQAARQAAYDLSKKEGSSFALRKILAEVERDVILKALEQTHWNRSKAARLLEIDRRVLFDKIKEYDLEQ